MLHAFRRYPPRHLKSIPLVGKFVAQAYVIIDVRGWLSDVIADPQMIFEAVFRASVTKTITRNEDPEVSVIMATRNNADTLSAAICSILNQRGVALELIVVDDASIDESSKVIQALAERDDRVRVLKNSDQRGTGYSRNRGMAAARGKFITFQDGDDVSHPLRLLKQLSALKKHSSKKIVTCNYVRVNEDGVRLRINDKRTMKCIISMMFPREEVLREVGYFREESVSEDADYYERIKIAFGPRCEVVLFRTLYNALFRSSSSFFQSAHVTSYDGATVIFERRRDALDYWEGLRQQHQQMIRGERSPFVPSSLEESLR